MDLEDLETRLARHHNGTEGQLLELEEEMARVTERLKAKATTEHVKKLAEEIRNQEPGRQMAMAGKTPVTDPFGRVPVNGTCLVCDRPVSVNPELEHVDNHDFQSLPSPGRPSHHARLGSPGSGHGGGSGRKLGMNGPMVRGMGAMTPGLASSSSPLPASPPSTRQNRYFGGSPRLYNEGASGVLMQDQSRGPGSPKERAISEQPAGNILGLSNTLMLSPTRDKAK